MTTEERAANQEEPELDLLVNGAQEFAALHGRIGPHFGRAEVRERVGRFLTGLRSPGRAQERVATGGGVERKWPPGSATLVECR